MNKLTIPGILAATVLIAGIFALMPVEKASTVHTGLGEKLTAIQTDVDNMKGKVAGFRVLSDTDPDIDHGDKWTIGCDEDYVVTGIAMNMSGTISNTDNNNFIITVGGERIGTAGNQVGFLKPDRLEFELDVVALAAEDVVITAEEALGQNGTDDNDEAVLVRVAVQSPFDAICTLIPTQMPDTT